MAQFYDVLTNLKHNGVDMPKGKVVSAEFFSDDEIRQLVASEVLAPHQEVEKEAPLVPAQPTTPPAASATDTTQSSPTTSAPAPPAAPLQPQAPATNLQNQGVQPTQSQIDQDLANSGNSLNLS